MDCIQSHRANYYYLHQGDCVFAGRHGEVRRSLNNVQSEFLGVDMPSEGTGYVYLVLASQHAGFLPVPISFFCRVSTHFSSHQAAVLTV